MHESQLPTVPQFFARRAYRLLLADRLTWYRTVPTKDQILVPETLLKKRKSQEKERADKAEERETKKKVWCPSLRLAAGYGDDTYPYSRLAAAMMLFC